MKRKIADINNRRDMKLQLDQSQPVGSRRLNVTMLWSFWFGIICGITQLAKQCQDSVTSGRTGES